MKNFNFLNSSSLLKLLNIFTKFDHFRAENILGLFNNGRSYFVSYQIS